MRKTEEVQLLLHEGMGQSSCWARAIYVVLNHVQAIWLMFAAVVWRTRTLSKPTTDQTYFPSCSSTVLHERFSALLYTIVASGQHVLQGIS